MQREKFLESAKSDMPDQKRKQEFTNVICLRKAGKEDKGIFVDSFAVVPKKIKVTQNKYKNPDKARWNLIRPCLRIPAFGSIY